MRGANLLAHRLNFGEQRAQVARRREDAAPDRLEARRDACQAGAPARPCQRLVLPGPRGVAAAPGLVVLERGHRRDQQTRVAVRAQRRVDLEQLAGGGAHRQPGDHLAHESAVDLGGLVGIGLGIVVDEDDVEVAAVAELLAAELAVGDDRQLRLGPVGVLQMLPGPAHRTRQRRVGERGKIVGDLLDRDVALDVAHQCAEDLGVVGAAQRVEQQLFVGLARALPAGVALLELALVGDRIEAVVQQPLVGELVDDAGMQHQVAHRPARQAEQAQQPVLHLGPLGQQGEIALAPEQRLEPVDELDRSVQRTALLAYRLGRVRDQVREAHLALVAQHSDLRVLGQRRDAGMQLGRQAGEEGFGVDRQRRRAAVATAVAAAVTLRPS